MKSKSLIANKFMIGFMVFVFILTLFVSIRDKKIDSQKKEPKATTQQVPFVN